MLYKIKDSYSKIDRYYICARTLTLIIHAIASSHISSIKFTCGHRVKMSRRLEPRRRYYTRKRFRFEDWKSSSDEGQQRVPERRQRLEPLARPESEAEDERNVVAHGLPAVQEPLDIDQLDLPAPPQPRAERFSMPPLYIPPAADSDEFSGHCSNVVRIYTIYFCTIYRSAIYGLLTVRRR